MFKRYLFLFIVYPVLFVLFVGVGKLIWAQSSMLNIYFSANQIEIVANTLSDSEFMLVKVMNPVDKLVVDEEVSGYSFTFRLQSSDPDGIYRYDAQVVDFDVSFNEGGNPSAKIVDRMSGMFTVRGGQIIAEQEGEQQSYWHEVGQILLGFANSFFNLLAGEAEAVDLTASSFIPTVNYDDTDIGAGGSNEWQSRTEQFLNDCGGDDDTNYRINDLQGGTRRVAVYCSSTNNERSFVVDNAGDIHFANDGMFFDRSASRLGIGIITPSYNLHVAGAGDMFLDDSAANGDWWFNTGSSGLWFINQGARVVKFNGGAPTNSLVVDDTGNIGIGDDFPAEQVDVVKSGDASRFQLTNYNNPNQPPQFVQRKARGTSGSPLAVQSSDNLGFFSFRGYNGSAFTGSRAAIAAQASQNWTPTANGTSIKFSTTRNGQTTPSVVMEITHDKKVKINGTTLNVPDYVFEEDYKLMPLEDLMAYIKKEKHLPNMASADEVQSKGLDLGGNQMVLLEKVEELTLYTLQQHEQLKDQKAKITALQKENAALRNQIQTRLLALENMVAGMETPPPSSPR
jgi:hypothetical protein